MNVAASLADRIADAGPVSIATYMAEANAHYYATRDPLGAAGDFTTAPEISQMFGELVGLWLADLWSRAGAPRDAIYVELGPGRGTLAADALRAMRAAGLQPAVQFVETSPVLRQAQAERVPGAQWHDDLTALPSGCPLLLVANEFLDALPIHQWVRTATGWRERMVAHDGARFIAAPGGATLPDAAVPAHLRAAPTGSVLETSPAALAVVRTIARRLVESGGAALLIDYGHARTGLGDTLQAVSRHGFADPFEEAGERDLTAHVDFEAAADAARAEGVRVHGPVEQGAWLRALGIDHRTQALSASAPPRAAEFAAARDRLVGDEQMGRLFKVLALVAPNWPTPDAVA
jgi:NADH dehydrogenase [ubiquinone] 1 alpha subcomplex assembly factor 7